MTLNCIKVVLSMTLNYTEDSSSSASDFHFGDIT